MIAKTQCQLYYRCIPSPVGRLTLVADDTAMREIHWANSNISIAKDALTDNKVLGQATEQLNAYFNDRCKNFELPFALHGTDFQQKVWRALLNIPYGKTASYADIAQKIGAPAAARAVGSAVGKNPLSIVVPCHRVIAKDGGLGGFGGGLKRKRYLLSLEQAR